MTGAATYAGRRVLVTGHTGFKGAWLCEWLVSEGAEVAGLALAPEPGRSNLFTDLALAKRMRSQLGDIRDLAVANECVAAFRPEIVFHLAAQALVRRSYADPIGTFGVNVMGTAHVLEAARSCPSVKALVCVTTDKVYENREWPWGYREIDRLGGKDPYSASKAAAELVAAAYSQSLLPDSLKMATARGGNVIGGGDWSEDRLAPDVFRAILEGRDLTLRNPGSVRPWQHVLELVRGYLILGGRLLAGDEAAIGAWNFGPRPENEVDVATLVEAIVKAWGDEALPMRIEPSPLREAGYLKLDISKTESGLGWRPALDFAATIALTVDWYRAYAADPVRAAALVATQIETYRALS